MRGSGTVGDVVVAPAAAPSSTVGNVLLSRQTIAEQIMVMPAVNRRWTASEVRKVVEDNPLSTPRYELVDGELLVTPAPTPRHQAAIASLFRALDIYVRAERIGRVLFSPSDVELEPDFLSQPDVFVVSSDEWRRLGNERIIRSLMLAVEVLSPGSSRHDRVRKRPKYQRNVPDYWIVDLDGRLFERWRPDDERPEILTTALVWHPAGAARPFELDLAAYFTDVLDS